MNITHPFAFFPITVAVIWLAPTSYLNEASWEIWR